jgi:large subunit ribosomal protein L32
MPNPKKKHSPSRRDSRRAANWRVSAANSSKCPQCGAAKLAHRVCPSCGFYNGELIVAKRVKKDKNHPEGQAQNPEAPK